MQPLACCPVLHLQGQTLEPTAGFLTLEIEHPDDPGAGCVLTVQCLECSAQSVQAHSGSCTAGLPRGTFRTPCPAASAGWRVLQGSYLPAAVADDLQAMQQHAELKEATDQLRRLFEQVQASVVGCWRDGGLFAVGVRR